MNGYIIEKYNNMNNAYTSRRYAEEAARAGVDADIIGVYDTFEYEGVLYNRKRKIEKRDFAILRFKEGHINEQLSELSSRQYNKIEHIKYYADKSVQLKNISSSHMRMPKYILSCLDMDFEEIAGYIGSPFVVKGLRGSQGNEIYLIRSQNDYIELRGIYKGAYKEFIFEEFIEESCGRDIRVFSIRGEAVACMKRTSNGSFKANFALGGNVEPYPADSDIIAIAEDIYKSVGLDYAGIDLLLGKDGYVFCEVNVTPGIEGIEKASGINIAGRLIGFIMEDLKNGMVE